MDLNLVFRDRVFFIKNNFLVGIGKDSVDVGLFQYLVKELHKLLALGVIQFVPIPRQGTLRKFDFIEHAIVNRPKFFFFYLFGCRCFELWITQHLKYFVDICLNRVKRYAGIYWNRQQKNDHNA